MICTALIKLITRQNDIFLVLWRRKTIAAHPPQTPPDAQSTQSVISGTLRHPATAARLSSQKTANVKRLIIRNLTAIYVPILLFCHFFKLKL
jgi:hypothetical protein